MKSFVLPSVLVCVLVLCAAGAVHGETFSRLSVDIVTEESMKFMRDVYGDTHVAGDVEMLPYNETLELQMPALRRESIEKAVMDYTPCKRRLVRLSPKASPEDWEQLHQLFAFHVEYRTTVFLVDGSDQAKAFHNSLRFQEPGSFVTLLLSKHQWAEIRMDRQFEGAVKGWGDDKSATRNLVPIHLWSDSASWWVSTKEAAAVTTKENKDPTVSLFGKGLGKIKGMVMDKKYKPVLPSSKVSLFKKGTGGSIAGSVATMASRVGLTKFFREATVSADAREPGSVLIVKNPPRTDVSITRVDLQRVRPYNHVAGDRIIAATDSKEYDGLKLIFTAGVTARVEHCNKQSIANGVLEDNVVYSQTEAGKRGVIVSATGTCFSGGEMKEVAIVGQKELIGKPGYTALAVVEEAGSYSVNLCEQKKFMIQSSHNVVVHSFRPEWAAGIISPIYPVIESQFITLILRYHHDGELRFWKGSRVIGARGGQTPFKDAEDTVGLLLWTDLEGFIVALPADRVVRVELPSGHFHTSVSYSGKAWKHEFKEVEGPMHLLLPRGHTVTNFNLRIKGDRDVAALVALAAVEKGSEALTEVANARDEFVVIGLKKAVFKALRATGEITVKLSGKEKTDATWEAAYSDGSRDHVVMTFRGVKEINVFKIHNGELASLKIGSHILNPAQCRMISDKIGRIAEQCVVKFKDNKLELSERVVNVHVMAAISKVGFNLVTAGKEAFAVKCTVVSGMCKFHLTTGGYLDAMQVKTKASWILAADEGKPITEAVTNSESRSVDVAIMMTKDLSKIKAVPFVKTVRLLVPPVDVASVEWVIRCKDSSLEGHFTVDSPVVSLPVADGCSLVSFRFLNTKSLKHYSEESMDASTGSEYGLFDLRKKLDEECSEKDFVKAMTVLIEDPKPPKHVDKRKPKPKRQSTSKGKSAVEEFLDTLTLPGAVAEEPEAMGLEAIGRVEVPKAMGFGVEDRVRQIVAIGSSIKAQLQSEPLVLYVAYQEAKAEAKLEVADLGKVMGEVEIHLPAGREPKGFYVDKGLVEGSAEVLKYAFAHAYDVELKGANPFYLQVLKKSIRIYVPLEIDTVRAGAAFDLDSKHHLTLHPSNGVAKFWISTRWTLRPYMQFRRTADTDENWFNLRTTVCEQTADNKKALGAVVGWTDPERGKGSLDFIGTAFEVVKIKVPNGTEYLTVTYSNDFAKKKFFTNFPNFNGTVDVPLPEGVELAHVSIGNSEVEDADKQITAAISNETGLVVVYKKDGAFGSLYMAKFNGVKVLVVAGQTALSARYKLGDGKEEKQIPIELVSPKSSFFEVPYPEGPNVTVTLWVNNMEVEGSSEHTKLAASEDQLLVLYRGADSRRSFVGARMTFKQLRLLLPEGVGEVKGTYSSRNSEGTEIQIEVIREGDPWVDCFFPVNVKAGSVEMAGDNASASLSSKQSRSIPQLGRIEEGNESVAGSQDLSDDLFSIGSSLGSLPEESIEDVSKHAGEPSAVLPSGSGLPVDGEVKGETDSTQQNGSLEASASVSARNARLSEKGEPDNTHKNGSLDGSASRSRLPVDGGEKGEPDKTHENGSLDGSASKSRLPVEGEEKGEPDNTHENVSLDGSASGARLPVDGDEKGEADQTKKNGSLDGSASGSGLSKGGVVVEAIGNTPKDGSVAGSESFELSLEVEGRVVTGFNTHATKANDGESAVVEVIKTSRGSPSVLQSEVMVLLPDGKHDVVVTQMCRVEYFEEEIKFPSAMGIVAVPLLEDFECVSVVIGGSTVAGACEYLLESAKTSTANLVVVKEREGRFSSSLLLDVTPIKVFLPFGDNRVVVDYHSVRAKLDFKVGKKGFLEVYVPLDGESRMTLNGLVVTDFGRVALEAVEERRQHGDAAVVALYKATTAKTQPFNAIVETLLKLQISSEKDATLNIQYGESNRQELRVAVPAGTSMIDLPRPNFSEGFNAVKLDHLSLGGMTDHMRDAIVRNRVTNIIAQGEYCQEARVTPINIRLLEGKHQASVDYGEIKQVLGTQLEGSLELLVPLQRGALTLTVDGNVVNDPHDLIWSSGRTHFSIEKGANGDLILEMVEETPEQEQFSWIAAFHERDGRRHEERALVKLQRLSMFFPPGSEYAKNHSWYKVDGKVVFNKGVDNVDGDGMGIGLDSTGPAWVTVGDDDE
eukprot:GHVS01039982.1.p1 GENE.GHVS01039982.1~~GHVS01039982.1.p1  ORF type:complete len:2152 (+),score=214.93 GHVS01039982.1:353-6808(+)